MDTKHTYKRQPIKKDFDKGYKVCNIHDSLKALENYIESIENKDLTGSIQWLKLADKLNKNYK